MSLLFSGERSVSIITAKDTEDRKTIIQVCYVRERAESLVEHLKAAAELTGAYIIYEIEEHQPVF